MRSETLRPANPLIERLIQQLVTEETRQNAIERRSLHRTPFFRPVLLTLRDEESTVVRGFSRNISPMGIGIVTDIDFVEGGVASIKIHSLERMAQSIISECRWSSPFGDGWFVSGWNFINLKRN